MEARPSVADAEAASGTGRVLFSNDYCLEWLAVPVGLRRLEVSVSGVSQRGPTRC